MADAVNVERVVGFIEEGITLHHTTIVVDEGIFHDGIQPTFQIGVFGELGVVGEGLQVGFL